MMDDKVTFSFGRNWLKYLDEMPPSAAEHMARYVSDWLGDVRGRRLIDVGSGSGLTSLVAHVLGAEVLSFDVDPDSVAATTDLWKRAGSPSSWSITEGSILDDGLVAALGTYDIVISWGVLHHTGDVWHAIDNAGRLVRPHGQLWLALYTRTRQSPRSLRTKRLYNAVPTGAQVLWRGAYGAAKWTKSVVKRRDYRPWRRYARERGMDWWRDTEDWLGGLPYEPVAPGEVLARLAPAGFQLERLQDALGEGENDVYLFGRD